MAGLFLPSSPYHLRTFLNIWQIQGKKTQCFFFLLLSFNSMEKEFTEHFSLFSWNFFSVSPNWWKSRRACVVIFPKVFKSSLTSVIPVIRFLPFGLLHPSLRGKSSRQSQFKFHVCRISVNTSISLDHPKCVLFWWLIFYIISKQKDNTDKSSTKTCHETRYWKKKALKQTQIEIQWFYYMSLQQWKRKKKARLAKEGRDAKWVTNAKCLRKWCFLCLHQHMLKEHFPMRMSLPAHFPFTVTRKRSFFKAICSPPGSCQRKVLLLK